MLARSRSTRRRRVLLYCRSVNLHRPLRPSRPARTKDPAGPEPPPSASTLTNTGADSAPSSWTVSRYAGIGALETSPSYLAHSPGVETTMREVPQWSASCNQAWRFARTAPGAAHVPGTAWRARRVRPSASCTTSGHPGSRTGPRRPKSRRAYGARGEREEAVREPRSAGTGQRTWACSLGSSRSQTGVEIAHQSRRRGHGL